VDCGLLVSEHGGRPIARADEVVDGLVRTAEGRGDEQVTRYLGQVGIEIVAVHGLEQAADRPVELEAPARREILVQRLPHEVVDERITERRHGDRGDQA
jgi:hypothetical protein